MASSVFGIGVSGLNAANLGLTTTGHNIANVNTDGFSRQRLAQSAPYPLLSGSGFNGLGVKVDSITRMYDRFLTKSVEVAQTQSAYQSTRLSHLAEINNIVADPNAGVSPALQDFFSNVQNVATNPASPPSRQAMLASAQTLVNRFQVFSQRLDEQRNALNGEITDTVGNINSYSEQIAELNNKIVIAQSSGQPPNDLLDQRDLLVKDLNKLVKANTLALDDGSINVFIGNGQGLVVGGVVNKLTAQSNPANPERITVGFVQNNQTIFLPENQLSGGQLGALLDYRTQSLDLAQNSLERTALGFAQSFNDQHRAGQDLAGNLGGDFWSYQTVTGPVAGVNPPALGAIKSNTNNATPATASLSGYINDISKLSASDYELSYDGTNYNLTRLSDNSKEVLPGTVATTGVTTADGLFLQLTATPTAGDRFTIQPLKGFISSLSVKVTDPKAIAAAAPIMSSAATTNTGTLKLTQPDTVKQTPLTTDSPLNPNVKNTVNITFNAGGTFDVVDTTTSTTLATGVPYVAGNSISYNGWTMKLDGQPAVGDVVTVKANAANASADNRNALALGKLQTTRILEGGSATYQESYGRMVSTIGTQTNEATIMSKAQDKLLSNAENSRDSVSAVNLDEEAANLLRYQQAYQAASKVIQIAQSAFQEIMNIGR